MNGFLKWIGWGFDDVLPGAAVFWTSPIGLFCSLSICVSAVFIIFHKNNCDDLFDRIWYVGMALVSFAATLIGFSKDVPHHLVKSIIVLVALRFIGLAVRHHYQSKRPKW